jgi:hypothetical protein
MEDMMDAFDDNAANGGTLGGAGAGIPMPTPKIVLCMSVAEVLALRTPLSAADRVRAINENTIVPAGVDMTTAQKQSLHASIATLLDIDTKKAGDKLGKSIREKLSVDVDLCSGAASTLLALGYILTHSLSIQLWVISMMIERSLSKNDLIRADIFPAAPLAGEEPAVTEKRQRKVIVTLVYKLLAADVTVAKAVGE